MLRQAGSITQLLSNQTAATGTSNDDSIFTDFDFDGVTFELNVISASVTGGTLDVYIQTQAADGTYLDVAHFAQVAASSANKYYASVQLVKSLYIGTTAAAASLSASSVAGVPLLSRNVRVHAIAATATFAFQVVAYFNHQNK